MVVDARLQHYIRLRFTPNITFSDRKIVYTLETLDRDSSKIYEKTLESVLLIFPIEVKLQSKRTGNFSAYVIGGGGYSLDLTARKKAGSASSGGANQLDDNLKLQRDDFFYSAGYGVDFYMEYKQTDKAKLVYDTLLIMDPDNPAVQLSLHDYFSLKGEQQGAFEQLKLAFANAELDAGSKAGILVSYMEQSGNSPELFAQGKELAGILLRVHPNTTEANTLYAEFLLRENKMDSASIYLSKATGLNTANYDTWDKLLIVDIELSRIDSLELHSSKAMEVFPSQPMVYYYNGYANLQLKNFTKALRSLSDGKELVNDNNSLLLRFHSTAGDAAFYAGQFEAAFKNYDDALKIDPDNTYVLNNYAYFLSIKNMDLEKAEKLSRRSLELKPDEKNYMDTYGWILYMQKRYAESEVWLAKAAATLPANANILEHYGDALFRNNKPELALKQWESALESNSTNESLKAKIKCKCLNEKQDEK